MKQSAFDPPRECPRCPRLVGFRHALREQHPDWWNAPVPSFGDEDPWLLIIGLAPGLNGANRTGRPFTGDYAGDLLFATLRKFGLAKGKYEAQSDDSLKLHGARIANAVHCLPPQNKPLPEEIHNCRPFLEARIPALPKLTHLIALGQIAHQSAIKALGGKLPKYRFGHGARHVMPNGLVLYDSYHCSRYNTNTGRLTPEMFEAVFAAAIAEKT